MEELRSEETQDSVLYSVKKELGLAPDYGAFDDELILHINSVFSVLHQIGVGSKKPFRIDGPDQTWKQFSKDERIDMVRTYVYLKVRLLFDPPSSATMFQAMNDQVDEYEFRLYVLGDEGSERDNDDGIYKHDKVRHRRH